MTVRKFIEDMPGIDVQAMILKARLNEIPINKEVMMLRLDEAYQLARILDVDAPELVSKIVQTEILA